MANKCIDCRRVVKTYIGKDDYYSCRGRTVSKESTEPKGENCFVKAPSMFDDSPSNTYIITDEVPGSMTYSYEIKAKTEGEARGLYEQGYTGRSLGGSFNADDSGRNIVKVRKKR